MWAGVIVVGDPRVHGLATLGGGLIGAGVGPFAQAGLDEALGLAVGTRRVRPRADVLEPGPGAGGAEGMAAVSRTIVGHDPLDVDAVTGEPIERAAEEGNGVFLLLVRQELGVGQARGVVDTDVQRLPTDAVVAVDGSAAAPGDAVANALDAAEFLGVAVQEFARPLTLIAYDGRHRIERLQSSQ